MAFQPESLITSDTSINSFANDPATQSVAHSALCEAHENTVKGSVPFSNNTLMLFRRINHRNRHLNQDPCTGYSTTQTASLGPNTQ